MELMIMMEKQAFLDSKIKNRRERDLDDIALAMIGEVIEWNEECVNSYKTWKDKVYVEENQFMEWVDVLFFLNQNINKICEERFESMSERYAFKERLNNRWESTWNDVKGSKPVMVLANCTVKKLINIISSESAYYNVAQLLEYYVYISNYQGYTKERIEAGYMEKLDINLGRIGCEWN